MTIFTPDGVTNERDKLLSLLMEWTTDRKILAAMVQSGRADFPGLAALAAMIRATLDEGAANVEAQPLTERQVALALLSFLTPDAPYRTVARYIAKAHAADIPGKKKYRSALKDLYELGIHLRTTYGVNLEDVPTFVTVGMVAKAQAEAAEVNPQ